MGYKPCKGAPALASELCSQILRAKRTPLSNNPCNQFRRRHVEGRIVNRDSGWCDGMAAVNGSDF